MAVTVTEQEAREVVDAARDRVEAAELRQGQGLKIALTTLNTGRLALPAICIGSAMWATQSYRVGGRAGPVGAADRQARRGRPGLYQLVDHLPAELGGVQLGDRRLDPNVVFLVVGQAARHVDHRLEPERAPADDRELLGDI